MSTIAVNAITDANGGNTTSINNTTPNAYNTVGKNLIINGAMQIAQRGTSFTNPSQSSYSVDRFKLFRNTGATFNISQVTSSPNGFSNSLRIDVTATDDPLTTNDYLTPFVQGIEGYNLSQLKYGTTDAEKLTLSFWVRSNKTGTYIAELQSTTGQTSQAYTINSADTWEKKTVTFVADTANAITANSSGGLWLYFYVAAGPDYQSTSLQTTWSSASTGRATGQVNLLDSTSNYLELTGVQLEVGESATEFEHRPYTTEFQLCQRYYYDSLNYRWLYAITTNDSGNRRGHADYPVTMRATPTVTPTWGQYSSGTIGLQFSSAQGVTFYSDSVPAGSYTNVTFTADAEL
jgi:hypothetical protein